jgi:hypothetical protein
MAEKMPEKEAVEATKSPSLVARIWDAINKDGYLAAAGRQGLDELGAALKAFPESIHVDEPGTIGNPTQGEIAAERRPPSPSEIAKDRTPYVPEQTQDHARGMER